MQNGYAICLNKWALDKDIKSELGLLLIISSLCAKEGYCFASNKFLSEQFGVTEQSISNKIKKLEEKNYIQVDYNRRGCEIISRQIRLKNFYIDDIKKVIPTIEEKFKDNNISINNTSINNTTTDTIFDFLEKNGFVLTPIHYEIIQQWEDTELTRYAIKQAVLNNKFNINYIDKIIYSYKRNNIQTVQQAIEREEEFNNKRELYYKKKYEVKESRYEREQRIMKEWLEKNEEV